MTRGLSSDQIGVTQGMIENFGDLVFELSHNVQHRRGDPIRELDFAAIEAQRPALGLADGEIARRLGLTPDQVTHIRNLVERRRIVANNYQRLLGLGGGRRFRAEQFVAPEARPALSETALALRSGLRIDPARTRRHVAAGWWGADTLAGWLAARAIERPEGPALDAGGDVLDYGNLTRRVERLAAGLLSAGHGPGDLVRLRAEDRVSAILGYLALARIGAVTVILPPREATPDFAAPVDLKTLAEGNPADLPPPSMLAAAAPLYLLRTGSGDFAVHTGHSALGTASAVAGVMEIEPGSRVVIDSAAGLALLHLAFAVGATVVLDDGEGSRPSFWGLPALPLALLGTADGADDRFAGSPAPGVEVRLDGSGRLELSGAPLAAGFFPHRTPEAIDAAGWLPTRLSAEIAEDGLVRLSP